MSQHKPLLTLSVLCTVAHVKSRFVSMVGALAGAGANSYGVALSDGVVGQFTPVVSSGLVSVEVGAAIAVGAAIECDATGRAITRAAGATLGRMAPGQAAASAAGQIVEIILIPN